MRDAFVDALVEIAEHDPRLMLLTSDLGFGVLTRFRQRFPERFINVGVAEQNMTGLAVGLALEGRVVFTYSIANFATLRCIEHIRNDACYHEANMKIVSIGGGFSYGALGISHHATEDLSIMRALPNMTVVAPGDLWEARQAAKALVETPGTAYIRIDKSAAPHTAGPGEKFLLGKARLVREGSDVTFASTGGILGEALLAAEELARQGISARVLSFHTVKPLDIDALILVARETGGLLTIEEHTVEGGFGGAVAEVLLELGVVPRFFRRLGLRAGFSSIVGSQTYLRRVYRIDARTLADTALGLLRGRAVPLSCVADEAIV
jgi:transketolase